MTQGDAREGAGQPAAAVQKLIAAAIVITVAFAVHANSIGNDFICDDRPVIVENVKITSFDYLPGYFSSAVWKNTGLGVEDTTLYRPLVFVDLLLAYKLWGLDPAPYHATNVVLHAVNALLVFFLVGAVFPAMTVLPALAAALVFAVHPVHAEVVDWALGRQDLELTLAVLGGMLCYVRYREGRSRYYFLAALVLSFIGMLLKEVAVLFPALIAGYDLARDRKVRVTRVAVSLVPVAVYLLLRSLALHGAGSPLRFSWTGLGYVVEFLAAYLKLLVLPWPLAFYFTRPAEGYIGIPGMLLVFIGLAVLVLASRKGGRMMAFGLWWTVLMLFLPLLVAFNEPHIMERVLYLSSAGSVLVLAGLIAPALDRRRTLTLAALVVVLALFGALTVRANAGFRDDGAFYAKAVRYNPRTAGAYLGLAQYYERAGSMDRALQEYERAVPFATGRDLLALYQNLGALYGMRGETGRSISYYDRLLAVNPRDPAALTGKGNAHLAAKQYRQALFLYLQALSADNNDLEAVYNAAMAYELLGERGQAARTYERFLAAAPVARYGDSIRQAKERLARLEGRQPGPARSRE